MVAQPVRRGLRMCAKSGKQQTSESAVSYVDRLSQLRTSRAFSPSSSYGPSALMSRAGNLFVCADVIIIHIKTAGSEPHCCVYPAGEPVDTVRFIEYGALLISTADIPRKIIVAETIRRFFPTIPSRHYRGRDQEALSVLNGILDKTCSAISVDIVHPLGRSPTSLSRHISAQAASRKKEGLPMARLHMHTRSDPDINVHTGGAPLGAREVEVW